MALAVVTEPFSSVFARHLTFWNPQGELQPVVLPHPIQNVSSDRLAEISRRLGEAALGYLDR